MLDGPSWLASYDPGVPPHVDLEHPSLLGFLRAGLARDPDLPLVRWFDEPLTARELDRTTDALAAALLAGDVSPGDRVVVMLQNMPQFVIAVIGAWKAGAVVVPANPMYRERELHHVLADSGAVVVVCLDTDRAAVRAAGAGTAVRRVLTTSPLDLLGDQPLPPVLRGVRREGGGDDLLATCAAHAGHTPPRLDPAPEEPAALVYTSGTTGPAKGAVVTHRNAAFASQAYREFVRLEPGEGVFGVAPLFHITGLIGHLGISLATWSPLTLTHRFEPGTMLRLLAAHRCGFTVGSITVFVALMEHPDLSGTDLSTLRRAYSGGAPVAAGLVERFEALTGVYLHNCFGMTETTAPALLTPLDARAPVDPHSGALAIGVPVADTDVRIVDASGAEVPHGELGEMVVRGPQVVAGYHGRPEETSAAGLLDGEMRSGDVAFRDEAGWFYLVDRLKDQINAAGFKVWPREVEDVLLEHPDLSAAAVVGVPDPYRGETVVAFVVPRRGARTPPEPGTLAAFCRERLAAYKCPRRVEIVDALPTTTTGKILRRELRDRAATTAPTPHEESP